MAKKKAGKGRKIVVAVVIIAVLGGAAAAAYFRKREIVLTVQSENVTRRDLTETVVATGRVQPINKVTINPEVSGEIVELPVKDGQAVKKGDLLLRIKPDNYIASRNSAEASLKSAQASQNTALANREKAEIEFARFKELHGSKLISESQLLEALTSLNVAKAQFEGSVQQIAQAKAAVDRAVDDLAKTTIFAPMDGTVTQLKSELGERVVGTGMMAGTEIMTVANLTEMEARVDLGEVDVVLVKLGQKARLEIDAFRDRKFSGVVSEIANAAKASGVGTQSEATKFEVKIRINEPEGFRPGMSVTADIETRYQSNVLTVPIQSVTTRLPGGTNTPVAKVAASEDKDLAEPKTGAGKPKLVKPDEVVFLVEGGKAVMKKVKRGISDDAYTEIVDGLTEGQEVVSGGYKAINKELADGKAVKVGPAITAGADDKSKDQP